jgi:hypothetical protein
MKRSHLVAWIALSALTLACSSNNPPPPSVATTTLNQPGHVEREDTVRISAVVEKIDHATRQVTLRGSDGETIQFVASPEVRNLDQVSKGDQVDVALYRSIALQLRKPGEATPSVSSAGTAERAAVGEQPGAAGAQSISVVATIRALDRERQTATLEGPDGELTTINVRNPQHFDVARVGDLVEITYTEAVAIAVEKK